MKLISFEKVGPSEFIAWTREGHYVLSARGNAWIVAFAKRHAKAATTIARESSERDARIAALAHANGAS